MTKLTDRLFTKITDVSFQTNILSRSADTLLSRLTPQKQATAVGCTAWSYYGCCNNNSSARYRRKCVYGADHFYEYKCVGNCFF